MALSVESYGQPLRSCLPPLQMQTRSVGSRPAPPQPGSLGDSALQGWTGTSTPSLTELPFALLAPLAAAEPRASSRSCHIRHRVCPAGALLLCWKLLDVHFLPTCPLLSGGSSCDPSQHRQPSLTSAVLKWMRSPSSGPNSVYSV